MSTSYLTTITEPIISHVLNEIKKKEVKEKILTDLVGPVLYDIYEKCFPYYLTLTIFLGIIIILLIVLLITSLICKK